MQDIQLHRCSHINSSASAGPEPLFPFSPLMYCLLWIILNARIVLPLEKSIILVQLRGLCPTLAISCAGSAISADGGLWV